MAPDSEGSPPQTAPESTAASPEADPLVSTLIDGKYLITGIIGDGGMGRVYRAEQPDIGRTIALKMLHRHLVENDRLIARFKNEARVASRLRHPNVALVYDYGVWEGRPYIAMEYVPGRTLREEIATRGSFDEAGVRNIAFQLASALNEAHMAGIVHRDLKPDNIICEHDPLHQPEQNGKLTLRVLDFGIAKLLQPEEGEQVTRTGTFFGTPRYSSPEQGLGRPLDARSDLYSLGVVLYEAITGEVPFDSPSSLELLMLHVNAPLIRPRDRRTELAISKELERIIIRLLEKKPADRFQSAPELLDALQHSSQNVRDETDFSIRYALVGLLVLTFSGIGLYHLISGSLFPVKEDSVPGRAPAEMSTPAPVPEPSPVHKPQPAPSVSVPPPIFESAPAASLQSAPEEKLTQELSPPSALPPPEAEAPSNVTPMPANIWETFKPQAELMKSATPIPQEAPANEAPDFPTVAPFPSFATASADPEADLQQGYALYAKKKYAEALPFLEAASGGLSGKKRVTAFIAAGVCAQRLGDNDKALRALQEARALDPQSSVVPFHLACLFANMGRTGEALDSLSEAITRDRGVARQAVNEPELASLRQNPRFIELTRPKQSSRSRTRRNSIENGTGRALGSINRTIRDWGIFRR